MEPLLGYNQTKVTAWPCFFDNTCISLCVILLNIVNNVRLVYGLLTRTSMPKKQTWKHFWIKWKGMPADRCQTLPALAWFSSPDYGITVHIIHVLRHIFEKKMAVKREGECQDFSVNSQWPFIFCTVSFYWRPLKRVLVKTGLYWDYQKHLWNGV